MPREYAVRFGSGQALAGVITQPDSALRSAEIPALILLNPGISHHVGPNRLHVMIARSLAEQGVCVLRFDLSGMGDSFNAANRTTMSDEWFADVQSAMDVISQREGINRFVLAGLGAGTNYAHRGAVADKRVAGAIFFDGCCYPTFRYYLRRYGPFFLAPHRWLEFVMRALPPRSRGEGGNSFGSTHLNGYMWKRPPKDAYVAEMRMLVERGVNMLYVFSGGAAEDFNYEGQVFDALRTVPLQDHVNVVYFPQCDPLFTLARSRKLLITSLCNWYQKCFTTPQERSDGRAA